MPDELISFHKHILPMPDAELEWVEVELPQGTRILAVEAQYDKPCFWSLSPAEESKTVRRAFRAFTSGKVYRGDPDKLEYIGSAVLNNGTVAVHVFERKDT